MRLTVDSIGTSTTSAQGALKLVDIVVGDITKLL